MTVEKVYEYIAGYKIGKKKVLGHYGQTAYEIARDLKMDFEDVRIAVEALQREGKIETSIGQYCTVTKGKWPTWFPHKFGDKK